MINVNCCDLIELEVSTVKTSGRISDWQSLSKFCDTWSTEQPDYLFVEKLREMEGILKKKKLRTVHREYVLKLVANIKDETKARQVGVRKMKQLGMQINGRMETVNKMDDEILVLLSDSEEANVCAKETEEVGKFQERVNLALILIEEYTSAEQENVHQHVEIPTGKKARAKLPKLELKKFTGKPQDWQEFWDSFRSAIDENEELSMIDKFSYLRYYLEEPAQTVISGFELSERNYHHAKELLVKRFARPELIRRSHINKIANAPPVYSEHDVGRLRELHDLVETHYRGLQALGVNERDYSTIIVPVVLEKIPNNFRLYMIRGEENHERWSMEEMLLAFTKELEIREEFVPLFAADESKPRPYERNPGQDEVGMGLATTLLARNTNNKHRCAYCLKEHEEIECQGITNIKERKNLIMKYGRCFICLQKGHRSFECRSSVFCKDCGGKHHNSICDKETSAEVSVGQGSTLRPTAPPFRTVNVSSCVESFGNGGRVALQTAQALVDGKVNARVRVLFDSGSHRTFVTSRVARELDLKPIRKERSGIMTFGASEANVEERDIVEITLTPTFNGGKTVRIEACVVDHISDIANIHIERVKYDYAHLKDLYFSDVDKFKETLGIDILLGADVLFRFQEGEVRRGGIDEPVAIKTLLGWVIAGPIGITQPNPYPQVHLVTMKQEETTRKIKPKRQNSKRQTKETKGSGKSNFANISHLKVFRTKEWEMRKKRSEWIPEQSLKSLEVRNDRKIIAASDQRTQIGLTHI